MRKHLQIALMFWIGLSALGGLSGCTATASLGLEVGHAPTGGVNTNDDGVWYAVGFLSAGIGWSPDEQSAVAPVVSLGGGGGCCDSGLLASGLGVDYTYLPEDSILGLRANLMFKALALIRTEEAIAASDVDADNILSLGGQLGAYFAITDDGAGPVRDKAFFDSADRSSFGVLVAVGVGHAWGVAQGVIVHGQIALEMHTFD